ncbi:CubicO group peptidase (beta-lactamase class C family) [Nocardia tenerifensis]|uniref:CubicO group peptidase (Beta-lactamase class C family) n=1 Tax=Nocardia tenerifensis TaxID=228006 RepID=A0A318K5P4_9NOCA|nr:serine hydrolase domain-containing protein [Nocardia tenerifensis]PXX65338.1 CubicO group peptidase (beta-lactamase class C family) [Nocardia tenerifensis]
MVDGLVERGFEAVRDAFAQAQAEDEGAAQLCVYRHGRVVVDLWTGQDPISGMAWDGDSLSVLMSVSKGVTATCVHMLVERGQLELSAPVREYWPEFAAGGKADITVAELLAHRAGLAGFDPEAGIGAQELTDWSLCTSALAAMTPLWQPGTAFYYHSITWGYLAGELIRRVTGKSVGDFLAAEVAEPLGLSLWIGLPESEEHRVVPQFSRKVQPNAAQVAAVLSNMGIDVEARLIRTLLATVATREDGVALLNTREGHAAEVPAGNAISNARSLARMYAATIGEVDGVRLLRPETIDRARQPQTDGLRGPAPLDVLPVTHRFANGYEIPGPAHAMLGEGSFGHVGTGGRITFAHPESGTAVAYTCTNMIWDDVAGPDPRWLPWLAALRGALG